MNTPVLVLMATMDGMPYVREQLASVLAQQEINVTVVISDDGSTDGTWEFLEATAAADPRVKAIRQDKTRGYPQNFFHLMTSAETAPDQWVALCDQDDVWHPNKLSDQTLLANREGSSAVSSSVTALYSDGKRTLVRKDYPQRELDFICESPGPGASYLLSPAAFRLVVEELDSHADLWGAVGFHDTLIYALVRASGMRWTIGSDPTLDYRQHSDNHMGANIGWSAAFRRSSMLKNGWYRDQFALLAKISLDVAVDVLVPDLKKLINLLNRTDLVSRLRLASMCRLLRRRRRDQLFLALGVIFDRW